MNYYDIIKHLGDAGDKQVNIVAWNGNPAKVDIRRWYDGTPSFGVTLTDDEAEALYRILKERYEGEG